MPLRSALARPVPAAATTAIVLLPVLTAVVMMSTTSSVAEPVDFALFGPAGADLLTGQLSEVFGDPTIQAGPFELLPWGVLQLLGVSGQVGWTVALTALAAVTAFLTALVLRPTLDADLRSSVLAAGGTLILVPTGPVATSWNLGHPAEVLVPLLWIVAGRLALRDRPVLAAVLVAASSSFEVWGVLGAPVVLLAAHPRIVRSALSGAIALAILWLPLVSAGPFHMFSFTWAVGEHSLIHLLQPRATTVPWAYRVGQSLLAVGAGTGVALLTRRVGGAWGPWAVVTAVVAGRMVLDPVLAAYYWYPAAVGVVGALVLAVHPAAFAASAALVLSLLLTSDLGAPELRAGLLTIVTLAGAVVLRVLARRDARALSEPQPGAAVVVGTSAVWSPSTEAGPAH
jgi:hypothetical protein